jgi:threonine dehydrogenase-like Zn-dependent dehydrogenase
MKAIVREQSRVNLSDKPAPRPKHGWVKVRVLLAGICRTDLHAADGLLGVAESRILGHEAVGEVSEAEEGSGFRVGERVVVSPLIPCEACAGCVGGARCADTRMLGVNVDGVFAEEVIVPKATAYRVHGALSLRRAAYVEPVAAALAVLTAPIRGDQKGLVLGAGRIADLTSRILHHHDYHLAEAGDRRRAGGFDYVVETAGTASSFDEALHNVRPGGVIVLKSRPAERVALDVARAVRNDVTLASVSYGPWKEAIRLAAELAVDDLLGDTYRGARRGDA